MLAIGGIPFEDDKKNFLFNGGHVVIGTVGRISELVERHVLPSKGFDILVLDEGDKLFENKNKRFEDLLAKISLDRIGSGTNSRQSTRFLIFSATYTQELLK